MLKLKNEENEQIPSIIDERLEPFFCNNLALYLTIKTANTSNGFNWVKINQWDVIGLLQDSTIITIQD